MNTLVVFAAVLAVANAGIHGIGLVAPVAYGGVLHGPGSHAAVVGPDGSHISVVEEGGAVVAHGHPGAVVAHGVVGHAYAAPLHVGLVGHDLEGHYIPTANHLLYDDGSYRPEHHYEGHYGHLY